MGMSALTALLLVASARGGVVDDLRGLPEAGSDQWDDSVRFRLLVDFDRDGSGAIDPDEVAAIPCEVFTTLDRSIAEAGRFRGLMTTYGFVDGTLWVGDALGFHRKSRNRAESAMRACGVDVDGPLGAAFVQRPDHAMAAELLEPLHEAGSRAWEQVVRVVLVATYDTDDDQQLGRDPEVASIPCSTWTLLDIELRRDARVGLVDRYGFTADLPWRGEALGLAPGMRAAAVNVARRCELPGATPTIDAPDPAAARAALDAIRSLPGGGDAAWDDGVRGAMVKAFDLDRSLRIDVPREAEAIPCEVWAALDAGVRGGGRYSSLRAAYGLVPESARLAWVGDALGLAPAVREPVVTGLARCGVP